jgi:hypothetical protein
MPATVKHTTARIASTALIVLLTVLGSRLPAKGATTNAVLAWEPLIGAELYTLYWGPAPGVYPSYASCLANQTNLTINNLAFDTFYYFGIAATQPDGNESAISPPVSFVSLSGALSFGAATNGAPTDVVSWQPVAGAASYTLYWGPSSGVYPFSASCPASRTSLAATVSFAQPFFFAISATDTNGNQSPISPESTYILQPVSTSLPPPLTNAFFMFWDNPASIVYGTPLGASQLNATATLPGTIAYSPPWGTVLNAGVNTLTAYFVPEDLLDYNILSNSVTINVTPAPLTVTVENAVRSYSQSNPYFSSDIEGLLNGDNITVALTCSATPYSPPGVYPVVPSLIDPFGRQNNYTVNFSAGLLTVMPLLPNVSWAAPASITYGTALDTNQLDAVADVPGSFAYYPSAGFVPGAGTNSLTVVFTPADSVDFSVVTNTVSLVVSPAPLTLIASNASTSFGNIPPFSGSIQGLVNNDNLTLSFNCAATVSSPVGTYPIVPVLAGAANVKSNYTVTAVNGTLTIGQAASWLLWTNPPPIVYGARLDSNQLNATASVPGIFSYSPPFGAVLDSGTNTLSLTFTPDDSLDYPVVDQSVSIYVAPAPLTVTAAPATQTYGQASPVFTGTIQGLTNGDYITAGYNCSATSSSPVGTYPIVPTLADPFLRLTNYTVTLVQGTLTVVPGTAQVLWPTLKPVVYGTPLSDAQLVAIAGVPGTFSYSPSSGTVLDCGTNLLTVTFTPSDTVNYINTVATTRLVVQPATLIVRPDNATRKLGTPNPIFTVDLSGLTNGDQISVSLQCAATQTSPAGMYPITATLVDPGSRATNYAVSLLQGVLTIVKPLPQQTWTGPPAGGYASSSGSGNSTVTVATNSSSIFNRGASPGSGLLPALIASASGQTIVLTWADPAGVFQLQAASGPAGVFTNVPGASSPYTNSALAPGGFFRLIGR